MSAGQNKSCKDYQTHQVYQIKGLPHSPTLAMLRNVLPRYAQPANSQKKKQLTISESPPVKRYSPFMSARWLIKVTSGASITSVARFAKQTNLRNMSRFQVSMKCGACLVRFRLKPFAMLEKSYT